MVKRSKKLSDKPRKKVKFQDEEILSDEASISEGLSDDFFEQTETPEEKRIRLAKKLISELESKSENRSSIAQELENTGLQAKGKLTLKVSKSLKENYESCHLKGHLLGVTCVAVYPSGTKCVTGSKDCCLIIWDLETRTKEKIIKGFRHKRNGNCHFDEILTVCVSDDGGFIASAGKDRLIHVWKTDSFEHFACFKGHKDTVSAVKFAYNSHTLFSCSFDRTVKVWEVDDRVVLDTLHGHYSAVHDLDCFIHDKAFSCGFDCSVRMWKTAEESQLVYNGHTQSIDCIRIINVDTFITGGQDGNICVWKTGKKKPVSIVASPHDSCWITSLASLRNTDIVASGSYNGSINLYQFEGTLLLKSQIKVPGYITSLDFSKNGKYLIAGVSSDHKLGRWTETLKAKPGITVIQLNLSLQVT